MNEQNYDLTLINEIFRNAKTAILSIDGIYSKIDNLEFLKEIKAQRLGYEEILAKVSAFMVDNHYTPNDVNFVKKTGMNLGIQLNTAFDNTVSHLAELMLKGTNMGIIELLRLIHGDKEKNQNIINLANELLSLEEEYATRLKKFI